MRIKFVFLAFAAVFVTGNHIEATAQTTDCSLIKNAQDRLSCYDRSREMTAATGSVSGTITWQYNSFVGTKGDVGANIILIKNPLDETLAKLKRPLSGLGAGIVFNEPGLIYTAKADGYGNFSLDDVPAGIYTAIVVSGKTYPAPDDYMTKYCTDKFKVFISDLKFFNKAYCSSVIITSGKKSNISHDFGNTYF